MTKRTKRLVEPSVGAVLGPLGTQVMRVLWSDTETTLSALIDQLSSTRRAPAYTTVTTILTRLRERGLVERSRRGREAVYRATLSEFELVEASSGRAVDDLIARYGAAAMRHFAERLADVDPELQRQLIALSESRDSAGKAVD
jgi:predicted transcriptional regulator